MQRKIQHFPLQETEQYDQIIEELKNGSDHSPHGQTPGTNYEVIYSP